MENYEKEPTHIEHIVDPPPFDNPQYYHMEVPKDKNVKSLVNKGLKNFGPGKPLVWYGEGRAISNAVSCAEIIKTYYKKPLHQITKISHMRTMETYEPIVEGLDPLKVTRSVPIIYILMSIEPLDPESIGYQKCHPRDTKRIISASELLSAEEPTSPIIGS